MRMFRVLTLTSMTEGLALIGILMTSPAMANPTLIGTGQISWTAIDQSGLTDVLSDGTPHNRLGGFGLGIAYTGQGEQYVTVPDRGPTDGTTRYIDRVETLTIHVDAGAGTVSPSLNKTTLLTNGSGQNFTGASSAIDTSVPSSGLRLDTEGIRVGSTGKFWISRSLLPEKLEGLAFGPDLADGRHLLLVTSDSDFAAGNPSRFFAFALDRSDLPGFQAQQIPSRRLLP